MFNFIKKMPNFSEVVVAFLQTYWECMIALKALYHSQHLALLVFFILLVWNVTSGILLWV